MIEQLIKESLQGNAYSLGRLISFLEDEDKRAQIVTNIEPYTGKAFILGITGPPGVGKSTLISSLTGYLRKQGFTLGVLCVDPTSPFSGGALLGDRLRMDEHSLDPGVFIRSLAARDSLGGLSPTTREAVMLLDASGKDIIIVESVGAGQAQLEIKEIADTVMLVLMPGLGDSIQMLKAGMMEIADIFVLNMADRQGADKSLQELAGAVSRFTGPWKPVVVSTVATRNEGVSELYRAVVSHREYLQESGLLEERRRCRSTARTMEIVRNFLKQEVDRRIRETENLQQLLEAVKSGEVDPYTAAWQIVDAIFKKP